MRYEGVRLYEGIAEVGNDWGYGCRIYVESSCVDRQKQGFDCKN